jgi:hypothetical protein
MQRLIYATVLIFFLSGCSPSIGVGFGGAMVSGNVGSEIIMDSDTGIHGSVVAGGDFIH